MPDIETTNTDRVSRINQATKPSRPSFVENRISANDLDDGVPRFSVDHRTGKMIQYVKINGQVHHTILGTGKVAELEVE